MRNELVEMGDIIRKRRELLGLVQLELASISGVSTRTIQLVEMGKANPSIDTLFKIADPLGLTLKLFIRETQADKPNSP
jgi:transcriptional regulator with XRE-family HTH domain